MSLVGIVVVSHSEKLAAGVCEVAAQMAPDISIRPAGGADDGSVGTSFDKIVAAIEEAESGAGVVILYDLGSAKMSAELAAEMAEGARLVDAPLVEGAIAAAVTAQSGAGIDAVARDAAAAGGAPSAEPQGEGAGIERTLTLRNPLGLHARPAARLVRLAAEYGVTMRVGGGGTLVDVRSVLAVVGLGLRGGHALRVQMEGERAAEALDAVAALVDEGFGEGAETSLPAPAGGAVRAVAGMAIGPIRRLHITDPVVADATGHPEAERAAFDDALSAVDHDLRAERSDIAEAHRALLSDPELAGAARAAIATGIAAAPAWWHAVRVARARLLASSDEVIAQRAADVTDVGMRVLSHLAPEHAKMDPSAVKAAIVVADDLTPSLVGQLADAGAVGIVLSGGGVTSHAVVVARGRALPMLVRAPNLDGIADGTLAILDADQGALIAAPAPHVLEEARARQAAARAVQAAMLESAHVTVRWRDGRTIAIAANVASPEEAQLARRHGADAIGLLRTEVFYVGRASLPTEDEQLAQIARILEPFTGREVTIRTLDAGGDKDIPALRLDPFIHGFLGLRGLRHSLAHPETLRTQLRAILRAAAGWKGTLSVMAPMVTTADEVLAFRAAIDGAARSLEGRAHRFPDHVGIMVEVPAAAIAFDTLAAHVDFVSVGTNDLVQYVMAAERTNASVAGLYQPSHPAIGRTLEWLVRAAAGKKVAVCGEMAAQPDDALRLVEMGVSELSMAPMAVPAIKNALRSFVA